MPRSQTLIATRSGSKYLQQLCKHWSHKFAVEFTAQSGAIPFDAERSCALEAAPDHLLLRVEAGDEQALERTQNVVIDHLKRFAFREDLGEVTWTRLA